jgi:hypothetical protein
MSDTPRTSEARKKFLTSLFSGEIMASDDAWAFAEQLESELAEAKKDAKRYQWMLNNKNNSFHISRNGSHACNYITAKEWISEFPDDFAENSKAEIEAMEQSNTIWRLQIYPETPISFYLWNGATLDSVIDKAMQEK